MQKQVKENNQKKYLQCFSQKTNGNQKILHINHKMDIFIRITTGKKEKKIMKNKKKIALVMIGVVSIAAMAGCGIKKDNGEDTKEEVITATPTLSPMPVTATATSAPTATPMALKDIKFEANDDINVREEPSKEAEIIDSLEKGDSISVSDEKTDPSGTAWYHITYNTEDGYEVSGYVAKEFVKQIGQTAQPSSNTASTVYNTDSDTNSVRTSSNTNLDRTETAEPASESY